MWQRRAGHRADNRSGRCRKRGYRSADLCGHAGSDNGRADEHAGSNCDGCAWSNSDTHRNAAAHCDAHTYANTDTANGHTGTHGDAHSTTDTNGHAAAHADAASYGWPGPRAA